MNDLELQELQELRRQVGISQVKPIHVTQPFAELRTDQKNMWLRDETIKNAIQEILVFAPKSKRLLVADFTYSKLELKKAVETHMNKHSGSQGWKVVDVTVLGKDEVKVTAKDAVHIEISHPAHMYSTSGVNTSKTKELSTHIINTNVYRYEVEA